MEQKRRETGISIIGDVPWGTHLGQFYQTKEDLLEILVPYFKTGLENNEFCMWVTAGLVDEKAAEEAMRKAVPDFERYLKKKQIEIVPHTEWYLKDGAFDRQRVLNGWIDKLNQALSQGYDGMRVAGNASWLEEKDWKSFADYEREVNSVIGKHQMIAICTYSLDRCSASEAVDVMTNHWPVLIKREGRWEVAKSGEQEQAEEELRESEQRYKALFESTLDGVFVIDAETMRVVLANEAAANIFGFDSADDVIGVNPIDFVPPDDRDRVIRIIAEDMFVKDLRQVNEFQVVTRDGREIWIRAVGARTEYRGRLAGLISFWDITERKRAEQALEESRRFFSGTLNNLLTFIGVLEPNGKVIFVNNTPLEAAGIELKDVIGKIFYDTYWWAYSEEARQTIKRDIERCASGESLVHDIQAQMAGGSLMWVEYSMHPIYGEDGRIEYLVAEGRDITERKQAEERIRYLNLMLRAIRNVNQLISREKNRRQLLRGICDDLTATRGYYSAWIVLLDESGRLVAQAETGLGKYFSPLLKQLRRGELPQCAREALRQPEVVVTRTSAPTCTSCPLWRKCEGHAVLSSGLEHDRKVYGVLHASIPSTFVTDEETTLFKEVANDIAFALHDIELEEERKQAEEALKESEEKYRSIFDKAPVSLVVVDRDGQIIDVNPYHLTAIGKGRTTKEDYLGKNILTHPATVAAGVAETYGEVLQGRPIEIKNQYFPITSGGTDAYFNIRGVPLFKGGRVDGAIFITEDITELKRAEEALKESEEKYRSLVNNIGLGIFRSTPGPEGRFLEVNPAMERITGYSREELLRMNVSDLYQRPEEREAVLEDIASTAGMTTRELHFKKKDGTEITVSDTKVPVRNEAGQIMYFDGILEDITERKKLEAELQKAARLESIGILAGGIAHDFNNILAGILGNITLAERYIEPGGKAAERLLEARKASLRAKDLTQQLLTFSKGGAPVKKIASIAELIRDSATFALRGSSSKCEFSLPEDLWPVEIDEGQMNQVITNLVINADEAMPGGGTIRIEARNTVIRRRGALPLPRGNYVEIIVEDHGIGISEKHLGRIFEPYFTTKQKGSGLGLATTYSIIKSHDGYITVESKLGVGTTFHIYLPASKKSIPVKKEAAEEAPLRGKGKILVMDDEEMVREMLSEMLRAAGYEVELVADGSEAIARYAEAKESGRPFDAVILDLTVPGAMGGKEAIKKLLEIDPDVKAIVSSGYSTDPIMADFKKYGFSAVVTKPYSAGELEKTLHSLLRE
ncbi:MAG TPA: PAS domain S-box protein [Dehalococcoidia bacterium]|nr:PAS domain S-box protein [Dehalococcoidia bacterium]